MGDLQRSTSRCATSQIFFSIVWNFRVLRLRFPHYYIIFAFETKSQYHYDLYNKKRARPGILSWHRLHRSLKEAKSLDTYQHRTLGTSRRHRLHSHTTPFHPTAGEATLSLPRWAVLAHRGSASNLYFYIFTFLHFYREIVIYNDFILSKILHNELLYIIL